MTKARPAFCYKTALLFPQLDPSIYESLQKERVEVGDVIYIEANSGAVKVNYLTFMCYASVGRINTSKLCILIFN